MRQKPSARLRQSYACRSIRLILVADVAMRSSRQVRDQPVLTSRLSSAPRRAKRN